LREIFLKTDNLIKGRYLAEVTKEVFEDLATSKYQLAEYRLSVYGRNINEWTKLADWVVSNRLYSDSVRWIIQVPRLYNVYRKAGSLQNFEQFIHSNIKFANSSNRHFSSTVQGYRGSPIRSQAASFPQESGWV
jgi:AMP deaminase